MKDTILLERRVLVWTFLGYVSLSLWFNLAGYSAAFSPDEIGAAHDIGRFIFFLSCLFFIVLFAIFDRWVDRFDNALKSATPLILFAGTGMFGLSGSQTLLDGAVLAAIGCALMGFGYSWCLLQLYRLLADRGRLRDLALGVVAYTLLSKAGFLLASIFLSPASQVVLSTLLAFVVVVSLVVAQRIEKKLMLAFVEEDRPSQGARSQAKLTSAERRQILVLVLLTVAMMALRGFGQGGIWGGARGGFDAPLLETLMGAFLSLLLYGVVALPTFRVYAGQPRGYRYHLPMLVLIACMMILVAIEVTSADGLLPEIITVSIELFCRTCFIFFILVGIQKLPYSAYRIAGFTLALSFALAMVWMAYFEESGVLASVVLLAVSYLLILGVINPMPNHKNNDFSSSDGSDSSDLYEALSLRGARLAREHDLTNRETEILLLLLRGRSLPYIQDELVLASGTVRTHVTRIYKKLAIHSKQELFDLIASKDISPDEPGT